MAKLWKGRFKGKTHPLMEAFTESISFDRELAFVDIQGSLAHAKMLRAIGVLTASDHVAIRQGMKEITTMLEAGKFRFRTVDEDIHMAIEGVLTRKIGEPAKKLHTARSRNDQVATDLRLWTRHKIDWLDRLLREVQRALVDLADNNRRIVMPGYTHLQRAQPVLLAQHLLAYVEMLGRDRDRLADARRRVNRLPLGACAMAGTTIPIDRKMVMRELGFDGLCENSMDAVSDRDFVVEVLSAIATMFIHLSRFSEDAILWASAEWSLLQLDDHWSTGSSIMPQKRNPDLFEIIRGKTGRTVGNLMNLLTLLKGLPMTYNRDLQEDKEPLFDSLKTAEGALACLAECIPTFRFDATRAGEMLTRGYLDATVMAEYLVEKGMPFREAHGVSGMLVRLAETRDCPLAELSLAEMRKVSVKFAADIFARLDPAKAPSAYKSAGNAGGKEVGKAIRKWQKQLAGK